MFSIIEFLRNFIETKKNLKLIKSLLFFDKKLKLLLNLAMLVKDSETSSRLYD